MTQAYSSFGPVEVVLTRAAGGVLLLDNALPLPPFEGTLLDRLEKWSRERPDSLFMSEPDGKQRKTITYNAAAQAVDRISARLLLLPLNKDRPLMLIGANGIAHALLMLAATRIGIPVAIISPNYCSPAASPWQKFRTLLDLVVPGYIVADDAAAVSEMLQAFGLGAIPIRTLRNLTWLENLDPADPATVIRAWNAVTGETTAKLLFTSGSTAAPKAVVNTQSMMVSNMVGLGVVWPFLIDHPPVLVDWLPWSHTFGGNCCFDIVLFFGGTLHIDDGRPLTGHIDRTITALRTHRPTAYFNVPLGYEAILPYLETDREFARDFLGNLDVLFNAAAPLPAAVRARIEAVAHDAIGRSLPIAGGWGATETAPIATVLYHATAHAANLGIPLPGTTIKLVPFADSFELRVRGPNVMPGYWRSDDATKAAFDNEGFYRIGDAGVFAEDGKPGSGILFDGRMAENFKLSSGTWVNVGPLRLALLAAFGGIITDLIIAGEGRNELALLLFCNRDTCLAAIGGEATVDGSMETLVADPRLRAHITARLDAYNAQQLGTSKRIGRFAILAEPPSAAHDELTEKGYLNQRAVLRRRSAIVECLFRAADGAPGPSDRFEPADR